MILAIDTATRWAGLALHDGTAVVAESGWNSKNNHTVELTPAIQDLMRKAGIETADIKGVAVTIGPGSYTGLRVGLALAKGLALAHQIPLFGIPTLDVIAAAFGPMDEVLVAVAEAGRTRICAGIYRWEKSKGWQIDVPADVYTWDNLLSGLEGAYTFAGEIGEPAVLKIRKAGKSFRVASPGMSVRRAGLLADIAWHRFRKGDSDDARTVTPLYLRDPAGKKTPENTP